MKKSVIFILFVLSINLIHAQKPRESSQFEKLNLKPVETVADGQGGKIDKETKALRVNQNEYFESNTKEADAVALSYLHANREVYGLSSNLNDIKIVKIMESPAGKYIYCKQYVNDIPVFATNFTIFINKENIITYALNEFRNVSKYKDFQGKSAINSNNALQIANEYLNIKEDIIDEPKTELVYFESMDKGLELAWKINISSMDPYGSWQIFVSASDRHIIHAEDIALSVDVNAKIFKPNPITTAQRFMAVLLITKITTI